MQSLTRRQFVVSSAVAMGGILTMDVVQPVGILADELEFSESACEKGGKKILVAYASNCGSTSGVAKAIADVLCSQGMRVDLRRIKNVTDISTYTGVVIGSAVKSASWYASAIGFVKKNQDRLKKIPVAYFLTCLALYKETPEKREIARNYFNSVLNSVPQIEPRAMEAFSGALDYSRLNMILRMVMKSRMEKQGVPEGDFRDFNKIESWARDTVFPLLAVG